MNETTNGRAVILTIITVPALHLLHDITIALRTIVATLLLILLLAEYTVLKRIVIKRATSNIVHIPAIARC